MRLNKQSKNKMTSKAGTLDLLSRHKEEIGADVLPLVFYSVAEWNKNSEQIVNIIADSFPDEKKLIVRSSSLKEDALESSQAGKYESHICNNDHDSIIAAIEKVLDSYGIAEDSDLFLVQPCLCNVTMAGVAFTIDPNSGGNYYCINYDTSGSTSSVTGGDGVSVKLYYKFKKSEEADEDGRLSELVMVLKRLEDFFKFDRLDVEFAFCRTEEVEKLYLLQVRPIVINTEVSDVEKQEYAIKRIRHKIRENSGAKPYIYGNKTIYSNMTDWNPAEMIGVHPSPLALSLYGELITDYIWAYQRDNYGYMRLRSVPLMIDFCGIPYIDVRVSFNSFIPKDLDENVAEKLVNYYMQRLREEPAMHDKVEFDIVFSCYTFDLSKRVRILEKYGFSDNEIGQIVESLKNLTNRIINNEKGLWREDERKIGILSERYNKIMDSSVSVTEKIYWLLEDCERYGTLPFAGLARAGFIAVQLLKSMVSEGMLTQEEYDSFISGVNTIGSQMKNDHQQLSSEDFIRKYGHLRPGTYDITSERYDENSELYFDNSDFATWNDKEMIDDSDIDKTKETIHKDGKEFRLSLEQLNRIRAALDEHGCENDVLELFTFIKAAIEGRESAKFVFTRSVSEILRLFGKWCYEVDDISREDASYADIRIIKEAHRSSIDEKMLIRSSIDKGKKYVTEGRQIVLPAVILSESDVERFYVFDSKPNYITQLRAIGDVAIVKGKANESINGKIIIISSADPGYDWIFSHNIAGLITEYGGANSHMAIRAGELSIPAAIGVGRKMFERLSRAKTIEIDAGLQKVTVIR